MSATKAPSAIDLPPNRTWRLCIKNEHGWFEQLLPLTETTFCPKCDTMVSFRAMGAQPPPDTPQVSDSPAKKTARRSLLWNLTRS